VRVRRGGLVGEDGGGCRWAGVSGGGEDGLLLWGKGASRLCVCVWGGGGWVVPVSSRAMYATPLSLLIGRPLRLLPPLLDGADLCRALWGGGELDPTSNVGWGVVSHLRPAPGALCSRDGL